ncbi:phage tail tape measure protein [Streptococcus uberis]|uniref:phage tail tape measure protein n=1 Tax=Streptococcus uberis TaxID=1349 RepID=UPI001FF226CC|nr:phage tail tape measure protein [Streptococcus uberis]MCK1227807.1 phage tail tape measure protein [Streptococcus uberis]
MTIEIFKLFGSIGIKNQEANKAIDETTGKAKDSSGKIGAIFSKLAGFLGTLFAGKVLFDFGRSVVQAAANAKAIESQFVQVFGSIEKEARSKLDEVAKQAGALPNRIKPAFNQIASFAKVTGMGAKEALDFTARATAAAADSAAFYDKSLEETTDTLKSYLKGNFEVADNLGILSTETTRNEAATRMFGKAYKDLEGQQQQQVLLKMYEDANKVSGAMGQAARESNGFENVMGNLKQAWEDFKASIGGAVLQPVVTSLQIAVSWIKATQEWLGKLKTAMKENGALQSFKTAFDNLGTAIKNVVDLFPKVKSPSVQEIADDFAKVASKVEEASKYVKNFTEDLKNMDFGGIAEKFAPIIAGIGAMATAWGIYSIALGIKSAAETVAIISMYAMDAAAATLSATLAVLLSWPTLIIIGIGLLVAAGVWLWQNWDTVTKNIGIAWEFTKQVVWNALVAVGKFIYDHFISVKNYISNAWNNIKATIFNVLVAIGKVIFDTWNNIKNTISNVVNGIKTTLANTWNSIKSTVSSVWNSIASTISGAIDRAKNAVQNGINKMKSMFNFKWSLPHITLPHFSVSGGEAPWGFMGKGSLPSVGVDWYAKGGIMTAPTLFGINGDRAMVGGEAGPEAVLPLNSKTLGQIGQGIQNATSDENSAIVSLLSQMVDLLDELLDKDIDILIDGDSVVAKTWQKTQEKIEFSNKRNKRLRGEV